MRANPLKSRLIVASALLMGIVVGGCQSREEPSSTISQLSLTEEQAAAIRTQDQQVADEEGGSHKVTQPSKPKKGK